MCFPVLDAVERLAVCEIAGNVEGEVVEPYGEVDGFFFPGAASDGGFELGHEEVDITLHNGRLFLEALIRETVREGAPEPRVVIFVKPNDGVWLVW